MVPQWLFGPAGDLRPLPPPDTDIETGVERLGTKHNTLSGRKVVDSFGHLARYGFALGWLGSEEYQWLEAVYTHMIDGPYYLLDPLRKNLLSRYSTSSRFTRYHGKGATADGSYVDAERLEIQPASWSDRALNWFNFDPTSRLNFDQDQPIPAQGGDTLTFSVQLWQNEGGLGITPHIHTTDRFGSVGIIDGTVTTLRNGRWERATMTFTVPDGITRVYPSITPDGSITSEDSDELWVATPQLEQGSEPTDPALGGGAPEVVIDSLGAASPRFPYQSVSLSLLEV